MPGSDGGHNGAAEPSAQQTSRSLVANRLCDLSDPVVLENGGDDDSVMSLNLAREGNALGLTPIHFLVTLRRLSAEGVIDIARRRVKILDMERLRAIAQR